MNKNIQNISTKIKPILDEYPVIYAGVFGSVARKQENASSDIDILISFKKPIGFVDFLILKQKISKKLNKKIDLISDKALVSYFKPYVYKDLIKIYE
jgi:predicted nucleotidyltransferase